MNHETLDRRVMLPMMLISAGPHSHLHRHERLRHSHAHVLDEHHVHRHG